MKEKETLFTYEFVTPSDAITFKAPNDKIAYFVAVYLGDGKAGCNRKDENGNEVKVASLLIFDQNPQQTIIDTLGLPIKNFFKVNEAEIKSAFESFAYTTISERDLYDSTLEALETEEKRQEFKKKHEDENRSSMNKWVQHAWKTGNNLNSK